MTARIDAALVAIHVSAQGKGMHRGNFMLLQSFTETLQLRAAPFLLLLSKQAELPEHRTPLLVNNTLSRSSFSSSAEHNNGSDRARLLYSFVTKAPALLEKWCVFVRLLNHC